MSHSSEQIRNIALCGHSGVGKTSLSEAMLFNIGSINRMGTIEDGSTVSDYDKGEIERQISLKMSMLNGEWKSRHLNILDTPGYADFIAEAQAALRVADGAVIVVDAIAGVEIGTERIWGFAGEYNLPRLIFVNKLSHDRGNLDDVLEIVRARFGRAAVQLQFPANPGEGFDQVVDLVEMKLFSYKGGSREEADIPAEHQEKAQQLQEQLVEAVAETDEELMEQYFNEGRLSPEALREGLHKAVTRLDLFPILFGEATANVAIDRFLDAVIDFVPAPTESAGFKVSGNGEAEVLQPDENAPLAALVFKTIAEQHVGELSLLRLYSGNIKPGDEVANPARNVTERIGQIFLLNGHERTELETATAGDIVALVKLKNTHTGNTLCKKGDSLALPAVDFPDPLIRVAIAPKEKGGEDKMATGLSQMHEEDPSFIFKYDGDVKQSILSAQGELHLTTIVQRLKEKFGVEVDTKPPRIPYRETIKNNAEAHYRHKKQSGGRGQFGEVFLKIGPRQRGDGFEFASDVVGGNIPTNFIPAVQKGIVEALDNGPVSGYQVVDVAATVYDGKHHAVDSDEVSFKIAGSHAFRDAFMKAKPTLLEPIYSLTVTVPEEFMGDVMGDMSSRRGRISGMDTDGHFQLIHAEVPLAEIYGYATTLRSMTQGKGMHTQTFDRYEEVPGDIMQRIVEESKKEKEAA